MAYQYKCNNCGHEKNRHFGIPKDKLACRDCACRRFQQPLRR